MSFTVLFWNIWLNNQLGGEDESQKLLEELERLCTVYTPDAIGLNEVLRAHDRNSTFVLDYLKDKCGYAFTHFAPASPLNDAWIIGNGFCSKQKPVEMKDFIICRDSSAARRGYKGHHIRAISVKLTLGSTSLNVITAHPPLLKPYTIQDHLRATKKLEEAVRSREFSHNTIVGGDFNEWGLLPKTFQKNTKDSMFHRTGSLLDTTWRYNAKGRTPIRANLDHLYWTKNSSFKLQSFEVIKTNLSDHRPLVATFVVS